MDCGETQRGEIRSRVRLRRGAILRDDDAGAEVVGYGDGGHGGMARRTWGVCDDVRAQVARATEGEERREAWDGGHTAR